MKTCLLRWSIRFGVAAVLLGAAASYVRSYPTPPADSGFAPDKGKFRILQQGNDVGTEDFNLAPSGNAWVLEDETVIRVAGGVEMRSSGQLRITADGVPQHYAWSAQGDKKVSGTVEFDKSTAKTTVNVAGAKQPGQQDFTFSSPRIAVLDNNLYEQYAVLGRIYDWNAGGMQSFPVLIPQDATPGTIDLEALGEKSVDGASLEVLRVHSTDLEIQVYFDAKFHLVRLEVPAAKVEIIRQK